MRKSHLRPQPRNGHVELLQLFGNLSGLDGWSCSGSIPDRSIAGTSGHRSVKMLAFTALASLIFNGPNNVCNLLTLKD